jgi:hypothetical protein
MYSKQNEIESIIEDLIDNVIIEAFTGSFTSIQECEVALEILKEKLDEYDTRLFKDLFE